MSAGSPTGLRAADVLPPTEDPAAGRRPLIPAGARTVATTALTNLALPAAALVTGPLLARALGAEGRGLYAAITAPAFFFGIVGTWGLQDALTHFCAERGWNERTALRSLRTSVPVCLALTAVLVVAAGPLLLGDVPDPGRAMLVVLATTAVFVVLNLLGGIAVGAAAFGLFNVNRVATALVRVLGISAAFALGVLTLGVALAVTLAAVVVPAAIIGVGLWRRGRGQPLVPASPGARLPAYAVATLPGLLATVGLTRLDQLVGLPLVGARELGMYAVAASVAEAPLALAMAVRLHAMGRIRSERPSAREYTLLLARVAAAGVLIAVAVVLAVPSVLPLVFGADFAGAVLPTQILAAGSCFMAVFTTGTGVLLRHGFPGAQTAVIVLALGSNLLLIALLRDGGAVGLSLASLGAYAVAAAATLVVVRRCFAADPAGADPTGDDPTGDAGGAR